MNKIVTSKAEITLVRDRLIRIRIFDAAHLEVEDSKAIHEAKMKLLAPGQKHVVLLVSGKFSTITKDAREFSAMHEVTENRLAKAMVVNSLAQKLIGGFFIRVDKPRGSTRMFTSEREARQWLMSFLNN